jgi:hypothetical protein
MLSDKEREELINRRDFTVQTALALLAGVTITISGCGGDDDSSPTAPTATQDVSGSVATNHGHQATITAAQLTAASAITVDIRGDATHPHSVSLTADDLRRIGQRAQVTKDSTNDNGHLHVVTFN